MMLQLQARTDKESEIIQIAGLACYILSEDHFAKLVVITMNIWQISHFEREQTAPIQSSIMISNSRAASARLK